jgi:hypothetical protein
MDIERLITESNEFELNRRAEMAAGLGIPLGILSVMCGFWYSLGTKLEITTSVFSLAQMLFLAGAAITIACSAALLWLAHVGNDYKALATASQLQENYLEIKSWAEQFDDKALRANEAFTQNILSRMIENADYNAKVNERRSVFILRQKQIMGIGLIFLALAGFVNLCGIWQSQINERNSRVEVPF